MNAPPKVETILIVDDHPMVREGIALRISTQPDLTVSGEAASEEEALALIRANEPDLAIIDISLKSGHGIDLIKQIRTSHPRVKMLVVSGFQESLYAERALRAGALGYLNKQESNDKTLSAIRTVLAGDLYVSPAVARRLMSQSLTKTDAEKPPIERLSDRELQILRLIGEGHTTGTIAQQLLLSPHTVDSHRENIKRKLGLANAAELARTAVQWVLETG